MPRIKRTSRTELYQKLNSAGDVLGEENDCAVIAVAAAASVSYEEAHKELTAQGRKPKSGTSIFQTIGALKKLGFDVKKIPAKKLRSVIDGYPKPHNKLKNITTHHPRRFKEAWQDLATGKVLLLSCKTHICCYRDDAVNDWSINNRIHVLSIYEVTKG